MIDTNLDYKSIISGYEALKRQVEAAIKDEQDAQRMYGDTSNAAMNINMRYVAEQIRGIKDQEIKHEKTFRTIMTSIDTAIGAAKQEQDDKKREEERKKKEESLNGGRHKGLLPGRNVFR